MNVTATIEYVGTIESKLQIASLKDANITSVTYVPVCFWITTGYLPSDIKSGDSVIVNMTFTKCHPTNNHQ